MKRKKVLFIQNSLEHYRFPLYDYLQEYYGEITICHIGKPILNDSKVKEVVLNFYSLKGFYFQKKLLSLTREYDVIVGMFDLKWPFIWSLPLFLKKDQRFLLWGIGVSTENGLDKNKKLDFIRFHIAKLAAGVIFYSNYPLKKYIDRGFNSNELFVGNNTIKCDYKIDIHKREFNKILFFGSLTKRKRVDILIDAYSIIKEKTDTSIYLEIVGNGPEKVILENYVIKKGLKNSVRFLDSIYDQKKKLNIFNNAICTVSPGQAGLSVLESFSFGVPFVTSSDAITGGERFNIIEGETGFFVDDTDSLAYLLMRLIKNKSYIRKISENCFNYYWEKSQIKHMAEGFIKAFDYTK